MKREDLKDLGLEKETIDKIMGLHQIDVEAHKTVLASKDGEISTLKTNIEDLSNQVKAFDGVDVEKLKQTANDWEVKYNQDLTKEKKQKP